MRLVPNEKPDVVARAHDEPEEVDGPREHECGICGKVGVWNRNWAWYGSLIDGENGKAAKVCSVKCREKYNKQHRVPHSNRGFRSQKGDE